MASKEKEERVNELTEINIKLDVFEGPLDLLLHLIQQMEIDIYDIPIATITEQYMNYIHTMKTLELAVAGEYLVMAATLMAIKSKTLLPVQEFVTDDEELWEEDPREELVTQLLEYRKYKYAAERLTEKAEERSLYYTKEPMNIDGLADAEKPLKRGQVKKNRFDPCHAEWLSQHHEGAAEEKENRPLHFCCIAGGCLLDGFSAAHGADGFR